MSKASQQQRRNGGGCLSSAVVRLWLIDERTRAAFAAAARTEGGTSHTARLLSFVRYVSQTSRFHGNAVRSMNCSLSESCMHVRDAMLTICRAAWVTGCSQRHSVSGHHPRLDCIDTGTADEHRPEGTGPAGPVRVHHPLH